MTRRLLAEDMSLSRLLLIGVSLGSIFVGAVLIMLGLGFTQVANPVFVDLNLDKTVGLGLIALGVASLVWTVVMRKQTTTRSSGFDRIRTLLEEWNEGDDAISVRRRAINLLLISFLGLFFELALIRWLAAEIKIFAYLKNVVLIAAFLGLGIGYFLSRRRVGLLPLFLPLSVILVSTVSAGAAIGLWDNIILPNGDQLVLVGVTFSGFFAAPALLQFIVWIPYYAITVFYFAFVTLIFIPLGQYTGKCMRAFAPIPGYSLNLSGSLIGTLIFTTISFAWLPPVAWFALATLIAIILLRAAPSIIWRLALSSGLGLILVLSWPDSIIWSPYHNLKLSPLTAIDLEGRQVPWGYQLGIGSYYYQELLNLSPSFFEQHPNVPKTYRVFGYQVPYQFIHPNQVLVLGAGTGNDVAEALQSGAMAVDAVDIDPAILQIGEGYHPEKPYGSMKVTRIVDDARSYIRKSTKTYDLVLFGFLDSQQVLSAFGSVRLDNYVYTVEGMKDAYALVKPGGVLVVSFQVFEPWIAERIDGILLAATNQKPLVVKPPSGTIFLVRKGLAFSQQDIETALKPLASEARQIEMGPSQVPLTTDDWPFLYLHDREMPLGYLTMLPILGLVAIGMLRRVYVGGKQTQWHFFFLGAAFMLMEVRIISQVALLFGSTWVVNAVAITSILLMAISANLLVAWRKFSSMFLWGFLLLATLTISSLVPLNFFLNWNQGIGGVSAALVLALPVFFASVVFSVSIQQTDAVDTALALNLAGAILGGFAEYLSLLWGIGSLAWIAAVFYTIALITAARKG